MERTSTHFLKRGESWHRICITWRNLIYSWVQFWILLIVLCLSYFLLSFNPKYPISNCSEVAMWRWWTTWEDSGENSIGIARSINRSDKRLEIVDNKCVVPIILLQHLLTVVGHSASSSGVPRGSIFVQTRITESTQSKSHHGHTDIVWTSCSIFYRPTTVDKQIDGVSCTWYEPYTSRECFPHAFLFGLRILALLYLRCASIETPTFNWEEIVAKLSSRIYRKLGVPSTNR